jgi:uncharacterized membrane protein
MSENANLDGAQVPQGNGMATASLILGICSIVLFWLGWIGIICGVLAIIFAVVAKNKIKANPSVGGAGAAKAGLITGIIGIGIVILFMIIVLMFFASVVSNLEGWEEAMEGLEQLENYNN